MRGYKNTLFGIVILAIVAVIILVVARRGTQGEQVLMTLDALHESDMILGNPDARVVLIEYGDYQCPACSSYHPLVKQVVEEYRDSIKFAYRHFPLQQHIYALPAAYAAEAAGQQGKFWEMHDVIYGKQNEWSRMNSARNIFEDYAASLGLNIGQFKNDVSSKSIKEKVQNDYRGGISSGINATPTFILNGIKIQPRTYDEFKALIDNAIANA